jgi:YHYH protein
VQEPVVTQLNCNPHALVSSATGVGVWLLCAALVGCGGNTATGGDTTAEVPTTAAEQTVYAQATQAREQQAALAAPPPCRPDLVFPLYRAKFLPNVVVYPYGAYMVIEGNGVPQHGSPYFPPGTPGHLPYRGNNRAYFNNGNVISLGYRYKFVIPACPTPPGYATPTPLGPIGVSIEGVPFYNQYAGGGALLGRDELDSFDQYNGHADPMNKYHHHKEPWWLTVSEDGRRLGRSALLGFLLDGHPVYGPQDAGVTVQWWQLDPNHGHTHATAEYPQGMYHYHITDAAPYINGNGFRSLPGYAQVTP